MNKPFGRRDFLKLAAAAAVPITLPGGGWAADDITADTEGKAVFYATMTTVQPILDAFRKATGVHGVYTHISGSALVSAIMTQASEGKLLADVIQATPLTLGLLKDQGILAPYHSPAAQGYPDWATQDDSITVFGVAYVSYLYNTDHTKPADAPETYQDLGDPKWKGQIIMANPVSHAPTISWLVGLKEKVFKSDNDWTEFLKALAANQPLFVASFDPIPAALEKGEKRIGISTPQYIVTRTQAPLDWAPRAGQPLLGTPQAIAITALSPRPAAARAFLDYWLSPTAMGLLAHDDGAYVLAPGVHSAIKGMDQAHIEPVHNLSDDEVQQWGQEFGKIFGVR